MNMLSSRQLMNSSFNSLQIVNTYGAFGSVTKDRFEIIVEGTADDTIGPSTVWKEYQFKGKPGDPMYRPPLVAPYHMRLDWLMWFAAMGRAQDSPWFSDVIVRILQGDRETLGLLRLNPFPDRPPRWVRAEMYQYHFTTPAEHKATGRWWDRQFAGDYFPAVRLPAR
jgi:hypothetical protein